VDSQLHTPSSTLRTSWPRLLLVGVALPALISWLDQWAFREADQKQWSAESALWLYGIFVAQTALMSWAAGRLLDHWGWRLLIVGWVLAMVDGQLPIAQSTIWGVTAPLLVYAFLSAQFGALALWGVLGTWKWPLRIPAVLLASLPLVFLVPPDEYRARAWLSLLIVQTGSLIVLLVALWLAGYRLRGPAELATGAAAERVRHFTVAHMFIWTAAAAMLLGVLRIAQPLLGTFGIGRWLHTGMFGICCALVTLAAIWATLGDGRWYWRLLTLLALPPLCGAGIWWLISTLLRTQAGNYLIHYMGGLDRLWLAWTSLAAAFLASLLLLLHTTGYRLVRVAKG
jgi:hypothetical protein